MSAGGEAGGKRRAAYDGKFIRRRLCISESVAELIERRGAWAGLLLDRLLLQKDDDYRFAALPKLVKSSCFPLHRRGEKQIEGDLAEMARLGIILLYKVEGRRYGVFVNGRKHTPLPKHYRESEVPAPPGWDPERRVLCEGGGQDGPDVGASRAPETEPETESEKEKESETEVVPTGGAEPWAEPVAALAVGSLSTRVGNGNDNGNGAPRGKAQKRPDEESEFRTFGTAYGIVQPLGVEYACFLSAIRERQDLSACQVRTSCAKFCDKHEAGIRSGEVKNPPGLFREWLRKEDAARCGGGDEGRYEGWG